MNRFIFSNGEHMKTKTIAPYFQDAVKQMLKTTLGFDEETIEMGGLRVYTTLDIDMQAIAEAKIKETIHSQSNIQVALVAMEPKTGEVKALVGGRDYEKSPFNRVHKQSDNPVQHSNRFYITLHCNMGLPHQRCYVANQRRLHLKTVRHMHRATLTTITRTIQLHSLKRLPYLTTSMP